MIDERRQNNINVIQNIVLENRERLNVTGINDIFIFVFLFSYIIFAIFI